MLNNINLVKFDDDATPYVIGNGAKEVNDSLNNVSDYLCCWVSSNQMKANSSKCYIITSSDNQMSIIVL